MRFAVIAAACAAAALSVGCGSGEDPPAPAKSVVVWVDSDLSGVLRGARIPGAELKLTTGSTNGLLGELSRGAKKPDVLLVQAGTFPSWDERADGLRDSRVVARDPLMLVTRKPDPAPVTLDATGGDPLAYARGGAAGEVTRFALEGLDADERPPKELELPTAADVLQALRNATADVGVVPRSVLKRARDAAAFNSAEIIEPHIDVQTAYADGRAEGQRVVKWLASARGRRLFAAAGYGPPGPDARPVDCPADASEPCRERG